MSDQDDRDRGTAASGEDSWTPERRDAAQRRVVKLTAGVTAASVAAIIGFGAVIAVGPDQSGSNSDGTTNPKDSSKLQPAGTSPTSGTGTNRKVTSGGS